MSEKVFFNPGQAVASSFDYHEAYVAAKIYRQKSNHELLLVQEKNNGKSYFVFDATAANDDSQPTKNFQLVERLK
ncbi:hypothetical protein [Liquorilactobacillus ghanensis]|uniref:hypothetical protein n=1 Tax=Liquorilactobacillus ghanensis TaxID=399370 RepID=UPI0039EC86AA